MRKYASPITIVILIGALSCSVFCQCKYAWGWDVVFRGDVVWAMELAVQYRGHWDERNEWPDPQTLLTRLTFSGSEQANGKRIDYYDCGLEARYRLEVHLGDDGSIEFYCREKQ